MRNAIPPIAETVDDLKHQLQREHDGRKKPRLQMLYVLTSGQAQTRQHVACLLGVHRNTIGRWLATYAAGGLPALLERYIAPGKPVSLSPTVLASIEQALRRPEGFGSYTELQQWVAQTHGVQGKGQDVVHSRTHPLPCQTQGATPQPHTKTLRPVRSSRRPVVNSCNRRSQWTPPVRFVFLAKMKAVLAC